MQNFYTNKNNFTGSTVTLTGEEYHHATRSSRVKIGEVIGVTDGCGRRVEARISSIDSRSLTAVIERDASGVGESVVKITVALSLIKPSRFEIAVEKCTELGAVRFVPLMVKRCTVKPESVKLNRLRRIVREAAKQSGRSLVPEVTPPVDIKSAFSSGKGEIIIATLTTPHSLINILDTISSKRHIALVIGPEGDFTDDELNYLGDCGAVTFTLGELILRSETAAIAATAQIVNLMGRKV